MVGTNGRNLNFSGHDNCVILVLHLSIRSVVEVRLGVLSSSRLLLGLGLLHLSKIKGSGGIGSSSGSSRKINSLLIHFVIECSR